MPRVTASQHSLPSVFASSYGGKHQVLRVQLLITSS